MIRPSLPRFRVLDAIRMGGQHRTDGTDVENVSVPAAIEDLRGECVGDGHDGDVRLLAQGEAKSEGTMRAEVADQDVRQRLVTVAVFVLPVQTLSSSFTVRTCSAVLIDGVAVLAFPALVLRFRFRFLVLGPYETAFNPQRPIMAERVA